MCVNACLASFSGSPKLCKPHCLNGRKQHPLFTPTPKSTSPHVIKNQISDPQHRKKKLKKKVQDNSTASSPSSTSSTTPPGVNALKITSKIVFLANPPLGGFQTPSAAGISAILADSTCCCCPCCCLAPGVVATPATSPFVAGLSSLGSPGAVRREGGSIDLIDKSLRLRWRGDCLPVESEEEEEEEEREEELTETATMASATASSSWEGSKRMFGPTVIMRRVIGGRLAAASALFRLVFRGLDWEVLCCCC